MKLTDEFYREFCDAGGKDDAKNVELRMAIFDAAYGDRSMQEDLWCMCTRDPLFYINMFAYGYDPRNTACPRYPFITYPFQDDTIVEIINSFGREDICIVKSRDMGASYMGLFAIEWGWHFWSDLSFSIMSYKQELVDKKGDPKSLFWKLDYQHSMQPLWLLPGMDRKLMHLGNTDNGSTIEGEFTTGNVARGDRKTAILLDEFAMTEQGHRILASTADATACRIFNSTPLGTTNAYYTVYKNSGIKKISLHWPMHPVKAIGLYYDEDKKPRSPWYDAECKRRGNPREIAQELDLDFSASDWRYFPAEMIETLTEGIRKPLAEFGFRYDSQGQPDGLTRLPGGPLKVWCPLDPENKPSRAGGYVMGCDIAMGCRDASSRSVCTIGNYLSGEKVAEYAVNNQDPYTFADAVDFIGRWFSGVDGNASLIFEVNGPGRQFKDRIVEKGYRPIWSRKTDDGLVSKLTDKLGFFTTADTKRSLLGVYREALISGTFINPSYDGIMELKEYVYKSGAVVHAGSERELNPAASNENHGDVVIADSLCCLRMKEQGDPVYNRISDEAPESDIPYGSYAWRRELRAQEEEYSDEF